MKKITLHIRDAQYEFARKEAVQCGFKSADEYLMALFRGALAAEIGERIAHDDRPALFPFIVISRTADGAPEYIEDPGGGLHHIDDFDDDIPF